MIDDDDTRSDILTAPGKSCGQECGSNIPGMILYAEKKRRSRRCGIEGVRYEMPERWRLADFCVDEQTGNVYSG